MPAKICCKQLHNVPWSNNKQYEFVVKEEPDIWQIDCDENIRLLNEYNSLLSTDEHNRADRYYHERDSRRFIISRGVLRVLLGKYLHQPANEILFQIDKNNKPSVQQPGCELHYNVSHSGSFILIAIAKKDVGIDLERINPDFGFKDVLPLIFNNNERAYIQQSDMQRETFYGLWTRKEALIKATGKGIDDHLSLIPCLDGDHLLGDNIIDTDKGWFVNSFFLAGQYAASIASEVEGSSFFKFE